MLLALSLGTIADPASARVHVSVVLQEQPRYEEYVRYYEEYSGYGEAPRYYVSRKIKRRSHHRCYQCHYRPRPDHIRYYYTSDYYRPHYDEVIVYQQGYHWDW
jgi:hypothetical protein